MKVRPGIEAAALTDLGCLRQNNEDNYAYWESQLDSDFERLGLLAAVADGMGGAEGGHIFGALMGSRRRGQRRALAFDSGAPMWQCARRPAPASGGLT